MFDIVRYSAERAAEWNQFVAQSKNGTFLFDRGYMDYHSNRFHDHSLMVFHKKRLYALLPANETEDGTLWSHQGLTYGGLITDTHATSANVVLVFRSLNQYLKQAGFHRVVYKTVPWIYHQQPAEEDLFAFFSECKTRLISRSLGSTIILDNRLPFTESRRSGLRKAIQAGLQVGESQDFTAFWKVLTDNLYEKYDARPVHTLDEITLLKARFPQAIRLYEVTNRSGKVLGGTILYLTPQVVKVQYLSASAEGKRYGAIDLLFDHLLSQVLRGVRYVDFGTSMDKTGNDLNRPLLFQKEGFGGRAVCYDTYEWEP